MIGRAKIAQLAVAASIVVGASSGLATPSIAAQSGKRPPVPVPSELFNGRMLYERFCAECHGKDLNGVDKKGPPFLHKFYHPGHHGDQAFYVASLKGVKAHHWKFGDMKPVEGVRQSYIDHMVRYVRFIQRQLGLF